MEIINLIDHLSRLSQGFIVQIDPFSAFSNLPTPPAGINDTFIRLLRHNSAQFELFMDVLIGLLVGVRARNTVRSWFEFSPKTGDVEEESKRENFGFPIGLLPYVVQALKKAKYPVSYITGLFDAVFQDFDLPEITFRQLRTNMTGIAHELDKAGIDSDDDVGEQELPVLMSAGCQAKEIYEKCQQLIREKSYHQKTA